MYERQPERRANWPATEDRLDQIERDLRPLSRMYWAIIGSSGVFGLTLALLVFIYTGDRDQMKQLQSAIYEQGTVIKVMLNKLENLTEHHNNLERRVERAGP